MQWNIDPNAIESADRHYTETLALPDLRGLTEVLVPRNGRIQPMITDSRSREIYADMIREVQDLLREIRFGTGTALMLLLDASKATTGYASESLPSVPGLFLTEGEIAALLTNDSFYPPSTLATDRHHHVGEGQTLGAWFGGFLLDTSLFKCHGLLDRLVVALWCHAQLPITETRAGELKYPTFTKDWIKRLKISYGLDPAWPTFSALIDTPLAKELVRYRHSGIHKRRAGSALNGGHERWHADEVKPSSPVHKVTYGMSALDHVQASLMTYREVVIPALNSATEMVQRHTSASAHVAK